MEPCTFFQGQDSANFRWQACASSSICHHDTCLNHAHKNSWYSPSSTTCCAYCTFSFYMWSISPVLNSHLQYKMVFELMSILWGIRRQMLSELFMDEKLIATWQPPPDLHAFDIMSADANLNALCISPLGLARLLDTIGSPGCICRQEFCVLSLIGHTLRLPQSLTSILTVHWRRGLCLIVFLDFFLILVALSCTIQQM